MLYKLPVTIGSINCLESINDRDLNLLIHTGSVTSVDVCVRLLRFESNLSLRKNAGYHLIKTIEFPFAAPLSLDRRGWLQQHRQRLCKLPKNKSPFDILFFKSDVDVNSLIFISSTHDIQLKIKHQNKRTTAILYSVDPYIECQPEFQIWSGD